MAEEGQDQQKKATKPLTFASKSLRPASLRACTLPLKRDRLWPPCVDQLLTGDLFVRFRLDCVGPGLGLRTSPHFVWQAAVICGEDGGPVQFLSG